MIPYYKVMLSLSRYVAVKTEAMHTNRTEQSSRFHQSESDMRPILSLTIEYEPTLYMHMMHMYMEDKTTVVSMGILHHYAMLSIIFIPGEQFSVVLILSSCEQRSLMGHHKLGEEAERLLLLASLPQVLHVGKRDLWVFLRDGLGLVTGWVIAEQGEEGALRESHLARFATDGGELNP